MRLIVLIALLICMISISSAECINEYRYAIFYPNGTQIVVEDWLVGNLTNNYSHQINSVNITYRNVSVFIPSINSNENKTFSKALMPKNFDVKIRVYAEGNANAFSVVYEIENLYNFALPVSVSIPKPDFATSWENCSLSDDNLVSSFSLSPNTKYFIRIYGSGSYARLDNSSISFSIPSKASISFSAPTVFSITKELDNGTWYANYSIKNLAECVLKVNGTAWAETDVKHLLFNFSVTLNPNDAWNNKTSFKSEKVPTFYIRYNALNTTQCNASTKPAYKVGNNYVVGIAKIAGITFNFGAGGMGGVGGGGGRGGKVGVITTPTPKPTAKPPAKPPLPTPTATSVAIPTLPAIIPIKITKEKVKTYVAYTLPIAYVTATSLLVSPVFRRRGFVVDGNFIEAIGDKIVLFSRYAKRMYATPSNARPTVNIVDLGIDKEIIESVAIKNGLSFEEVESIILAVHMKRPLFVGNEKAAEVARRYGVMAYTLEDILKYSYV